MNRAVGACKEALLTSKEMITRSGKYLSAMWIQSQVGATPVSFRHSLDAGAVPSAAEPWRGEINVTN